MSNYLIFDHDPAEGDLPDAVVEADDPEEAAYGYTCDQSWMDEGHTIEIWVQEVDSGVLAHFYCRRPYRDGAYDPEIEDADND